MKYLILALCLVASTSYARPDWGNGEIFRVVKVSDGDTITVLDSKKVQHKIRLYGIDAPEIAQPFGDKSKESLSRRIEEANWKVLIEPINKDRYGRTVAIVYPCHWDALAMSCTATSSLNEDQILYGYAWAYTQYLNKKYKEQYVMLQRIAMMDKVGIWSDKKEPIAPWKFRRIVRAILKKESRP